MAPLKWLWRSAPFGIRTRNARRSLGVARAASKERAICCKPSAFSGEDGSWVCANAEAEEAKQSKKDARPEGNGPSKKNPFCILPYHRAGYSQTCKRNWRVSPAGVAAHGLKTRSESSCSDAGRPHQNPRGPWS